MNTDTLFTILTGYDCNISKNISSKQNLERNTLYAYAFT